MTYTRYFVNVPGHSTADQYAAAISELKAAVAACCSDAVKTCCGKPHYVRFVTGRYAGRVYPIDTAAMSAGGPLVFMQPISTVRRVTCDVFGVVCCVWCVVCCV